mgnify:CR=1 FL=1
MSSQPQLPPETDMNPGDVTYEATPRWLADLVLKASRLMGRYPGLLDTAEQRQHATAFTSVFMLRMAMGEAATDEAHDAVFELLDLDASGTLTFKEFASGMLTIGALLQLPNREWTGS